MKQLFKSLFLLLTLTAPHTLWAQIRLVPNGDGTQVWVWITQPLRSGDGFHVYRKTGSEAFQKLTVSPIRSIETPEELPARMGAAYESLRQQLDEVTPSAVWFRLRGDRNRATLLGYVYPTLAQAMGQLWVDEKAPTGQEATYKVEWVNVNDAPISGKTATESLRIHPEIPPEPTELTAENTGNKVALKWKYPVSDADFSDHVIQFILYRRQGQAPFQRIHAEPLLREGNQAQQAYYDVILNHGQVYQYQVVAINAAGTQSGTSNMVTLSSEDNQAPDVLDHVEAVIAPNGKLATITFPVSPDAGTKGYWVYRSESIEKDFVRLNEVPLSPVQSVYEDRTITVGKTYYYRIAVLDVAGNESRQSNAAMAEVADHTPPSAPTNLHAQKTSDRRIELTWSSDAQPEDFLTYVVLRRPVRKPTVAYDQLNRENLRVTAFVDADLADQRLSEGLQYEYVVAAMDKKQNFSDSVKVLVHIEDVTPPLPPAVLRAENIQGRAIQLTFSASISPDAQRYQLLKQVGDAAPEPWRNVTDTRVTLRDEEVKSGTRYTYWIAALDAAGNASKLVASNTLPFTQTTLPPIVQNLQSRVEGQTVLLRWEASPAPNLATYRIYRTTIMPTGLYTQLAEVSATTTEWRDPSAPEKGYYVVRAVNRDGLESPASAFAAGR